jgi:hypothetical protein
MTLARTIAVCVAFVGTTAALCLTAGAGGSIEAADFCSAMREATVQIRGDFVLFQPDELRIDDFRAGSGFWVGDGVVVTANHVINRMDRIEVCDSAEVCHPVTGVIGYPDVDVAVLRIDGAPYRPPRVFRIVSPRGPGQAIVAAGYPGDVGYVCGPGNLTGQVDSDQIGDPFLLFQGTIAAEGSSGGPIAAFGRSVKRLEAIGAVSGATDVGSVRFNRAAPLSLVAAQGSAPAWHDPVEWRREQPWTEALKVPLDLRPGEPYWEDLFVPGYQDVRMQADPPDGLCYGFYEAPDSVFAEILEPRAITWECEGSPILYTTGADQTIRLAIWTDEAEGWTGTIGLLLR